MFPRMNEMKFGGAKIYYIRIKTIEQVKLTEQVKRSCNTNKLRD